MLTICIPTYNRRIELEVALNGLARVFGNTVHVAISDNCSTDATLEFLKAYADYSPFASFQYVVNERNMGVDFNFLKAVSLGRTEYSILFGSDDTPTENAPELINAAIADGADIAVFGRRLYTRNLKRAIGDEIYWTGGTRTTWHLETEREYAEYFDTCTSLAGAFSFISAILFKNSIWRVDDHVRSFIGFYYVHVAALFQGMKELGAVRLVTDPRPVVCCRLGNDSFVDNGVFRRFEMDWNGYERLAREYFNGPARKSLMQVLRFQCSAFGLASLRYHIVAEGRREQIALVTERLRSSEWGQRPLVRWRVLTFVPQVILKLLFKVRRVLRGGRDI
jgi:abequosyltransferase